MKRLLFLALAVIMLFLGASAWGTEKYARETGKGCSFCHQMRNGGPLNNVGLAYVRNGYSYPIPERILSRAQRLHSPPYITLRRIAGFVHLVVACIFVGVIFYVHIFVKPARLAGGIPRGERILGLSCISTLTVTGIYLTWYRLDTPSAFFHSHFGILLFAKLLLFTMMLLLALTAVTIVHRMMRRESSGVGDGASTIAPAVTRENLHLFDGTDGKPAYFIYGDTVYDVTGSDKWAGGSHFRKHSAGRDLTDDIGGAPHGPEVLEGMPVVSRIEETSPPEKKTSADAASRPGAARRVFVVMAHANLVLVLLILFCVSSWMWGVPIPLDEAKGSHAREGACLDCHMNENPGIYYDWKGSIHAKVGVGCADCHSVQDDSTLMSSGDHYEHSDIPVTPIVTPDRCGTCHQEQASQYARSKHAHTLEIMEKIDAWVIYGMNNESELATGCLACHGSVVRFSDNGRPIEGSWPNVGVGRINPDGTAGSCTSCHTRHGFSLVEARKPEACDQCHLGPDHPQIEIYNESKHGTIYHAEGDSWSWRTDDMIWKAGRDYRAPTCASCHMSESVELSKTHDVTERLSWELQAPLTIRPEDFTPFPAPVPWTEGRKRMKSICLQCHSSGWTDSHFANLDDVIENYNENYYRPVEELFVKLRDSKILSEAVYFDEPLEWEFYELWHHEGRRARMGAAMMAPDYSWWHGFYELKHRYATFVLEAERALRTGRAARFDSIPGMK
jgi:predicted heme/steroid binding protein/cytochrome c553